MRFVTEEAGFAQVFTVNRDGFPTGRTMVAVLNEDWSVDLVQRKVHRRMGQLRRDPHVEVLWSGPALSTSVNEHPHVYDYGLPIPRAVFVRGPATVMDDGWTIERFERRTGIQRGKGHLRAPLRSRENVREELAGVRIEMVQVRAEGFGDGPQVFTWGAGGEP